MEKGGGYRRYEGLMDPRQSIEESQKLDEKNGEMKLFKERCDALEKERKEWKEKVIIEARKKYEKMDDEALEELATYVVEYPFEEKYLQICREVWGSDLLNWPNDEYEGKTSDRDDWESGRKGVYFLPSQVNGEPDKVTGERPTDKIWREVSETRVKRLKEMENWLKEAMNK